MSRRIALAHPTPPRAVDQRKAPGGGLWGWLPVVRFYPCRRHRAWHERRSRCWTQSRSVEALTGQPVQVVQRPPQAADMPAKRVGEGRIHCKRLRFARKGIYEGTIAHQNRGTFGRHRRDRPGLCWPAAGSRLRGARLPGGRHRRGRDEGGRAQSRGVVCAGYPAGAVARYQVEG